MEALSFEERLRLLSDEAHSLLGAAQSAKVRQKDARAKADEEQRILVSRVRSLRRRGVPTKTIALALGMSKSWVTRFGR